MKRFDCEDCGQIDYVLMDGYAFGEKVLEGVMFKVSAPRAGQIKVEVHPDYKKYFSSLNTKKWLKEALEHAKQNDMATCPNCGGDCGAQPV